MNDKKLKQFIKKRKYLMWHVKDPEKVADIFNKQLEKKRDNYKDEIKNYFKMYFEKYV